MQMLLNIPDKYVSLDKSFQEMILEMDADGVRGIATILPEGHGRLIDADATIKEFGEWPDVWDKYAIGCLESAETIIEADKEIRNERVYQD